MIGEWDLYTIITILGNIVIMFLYLISLSSDRKLKLAATFFTIVLVSSLLSLREQNVALDARTYAFLFEKGRIQLFYNSHIYEIGYIILNVILNFFVKDYSTLFFITTFLHLSLIVALFRRLSLEEFPLLLSMYLATFVFWLSTISMLRQGLAIPLVALAIYYLYSERKPSKFFFLSAIATSIHFSALPISIFSLICYFFLDKITLKWKKILGLVFIILVLYPKNIFIPSVLSVVKLLARYTCQSPLLNKIIWYFNWNKLSLWQVKHVYFLFLLLVMLLLIKEKKEWILNILLLPLTFLAILRYDEMMTDRIFMYFVPFIPFFITRLYYIYILNKSFFGKLIWRLILLYAILIWFNVKFLYLQYKGWFIFPYPKVR